MGQYRETNVIDHEASDISILFTRGSSASDVSKKINEIRAADNKTFHQESVLREDEQPSCVSFLRQLLGIKLPSTTTSWPMCTTAPSAVSRAVILGWSSPAVCGVGASRGASRGVLDRCLEERTKGL